MIIKPNVKIRRVQRIGSMDRYGNAVLEVVYSNIIGCLQRKTEFFRTPNGDTKQIDGTLIVQGYLEIHADDVIVMDTPQSNEYRVFTEEEELDANGCVILRTLRLVKIVQQS